MPISFSDLSGGATPSLSQFWYAATIASGATYGSKADYEFQPGYYKISVYPTVTGQNTIAGGIFNFIQPNGSILTTTSTVDDDSARTNNPSVAFINLPNGATSVYSTNITGNVLIEKVGERLVSLTGSLSVRTSTQNFTINANQQAHAVIIGGGGGGGGPAGITSLSNENCYSEAYAGKGGGGSGYLSSLQSLGPGSYSFISGAGVSSGTAGTSYLSGGSLPATVSAAGGSSGIGYTGGAGAANGGSVSIGGSACGGLIISHGSGQTLPQVSGAFWMPRGSGGSGQSSGTRSCAGGGGGFAAGGTDLGNGSQGSGGAGGNTTGGNGALALMIWS